MSETFSASVKNMALLLLIGWIGYSQLSPTKCFNYQNSCCDCILYCTIQARDCLSSCRERKMFRSSFIFTNFHLADCCKNIIIKRDKRDFQCEIVCLSL